MPSSGAGSPSQASFSPDPAAMASLSQPSTPGQNPAIPQQGQQPPQTQAQWEGIRDAAKRLGHDLPFQDDGAALNALVNAWGQGQQRNAYADLGMQMAPHARQFQEWLASQQPAQQPAQEGPWSPPKFDERYWSVVEQDPETGRVRSKAGYSPVFGEQAQAYLDYVQESQRQMQTNPVEWVQRMAGGYIQEQIQKGIQQSLGGYQTKVQAESLVQQNANWIFQVDHQGNRVINPQTGRPALSPAGASYARHADYAAKQLGIMDVKGQDRYARDQLELEIYRQQQRQAQAPPPVQPGGPMAGAIRTPNFNAANVTQNPAAPPAEPMYQPNPNNSFEAMIKADMAQAGIDESNYRQHMLEPGMTGNFGGN